MSDRSNVRALPGTGRDRLWREDDQEQHPPPFGGNGKVAEPA